MELPNGHYVRCTCGKSDCVELTGRLGEHCHEMGNLFIPNAFLTAYRLPGGEIDRRAAAQSHLKFIRELPSYGTGFVLKDAREDYLAGL